MNKKRMHRVMYGFLGILGIFVGMLLILPAFFPIDRYKPQISAKATEALGRPVSIEGKISLSLFPTPQVSINDVRIANLAGGSSQDFLRMKALTVSVNLFPLLRKKIEIKAIDLDQPDIFLEKLADGRENWRLLLENSVGQPSSPSSPAPSIQMVVDKALIHKGRIVYREKGKDTEIQNINVSGKLASLQGPYEIMGTLHTFGHQLKIEANLGMLSDNQDIFLTVHADGARGELKGKMSIPSLTFQGNLKGSGDPKVFMPAKGALKASPLLAQPLTAEAMVKATPKAISIPQIILDVGGARPAGSLEIFLQGPLTLQGNFKGFPGQGQCKFTLTPSAQGMAGSLTATVNQTPELFGWVGIPAAALSPTVHGPLTLSTAYVFGDDIQLKNLNLTVQPAKLQGTLLWQSQKGNPRVVLDVGSPKIEGILKLFGVKDPKLTGIGKLRGDIQWTPTSLRLGQLKGQFGKNLNFTGDVSVNHDGPKPTVKASLSFNTISMDTLLASRQGHDTFNPEGQIFLISAKPSSTRSPWSHNPVDLSFLTKINGQFDISASQLRHKDIIVTRPKVIASLQNGRMDIKALTGNIFDGPLIGNGHITADNTMRLHLALKEANLKNLVPHRGHIKLVGGKAFFTSDLSTHGDTLYAMIQNLTGAVNITAKDGVVNGFDLHALSQQLGNLQNARSLLGLLTTSMGKGQTRFSSFKGDIIFNNGIGMIQSMDLVAPDAQGQASGQIDLPGYLLNIHAEFRLTNHPQLPSFQMRLAGPIDNPSRELDTGALQKYMLENVFKGAIERLGKGKLNDGNILGSLLGNESPPKDQLQKGNNPIDKPEKIVKDIFKGIF